MTNTCKRFGAPLAALTLAALSACAPGRAIVRGNWPDGRIDVAARSAPATMPVAVPAPDAVVDESPSSDPPGSRRSPADLNEMGVLQPVYFDSDSDRIGSDQAAVMEANTAWLVDNPTARILIEGHCDDRGTPEYNFALARRRAEAVRDDLIKRGVDPWQIEEIVEYGEELLVDLGHTDSARARNRRVELRIQSL